MRKIGYARVSTVEQNTDLQIDALAQAGCAVIFSERLSAMARSRPKLEAALEELQPGDALVVWKLDRLGRSMAQLIQTVDDLGRRGIEIQSVTEGFDTRTPSGKMLFHVIGAVAEMERGIISERVTSGMATAQRHGRHVGRPAKVTPEMIEMAQTMRDSGKSWSAIARGTGVHRATLSRAVIAHEAAEAKKRRKRKAI